MNTPKAQHTPGPWRVHDKHQKFNPLILAGPDEAAKSILLAEVRNNDSRLGKDEARSNARLIAAAPALLKALRAMTDAYAKAMKDAGVTHYPEALAVVRQAREVIAQATGQ